MSDQKPLETEPYKGVRDFYPADWATLSALFSTTRDVLGRYGYEEYQASPLERSEIYEKKGNEEIIREQTYTFEDRGGRRVTLRPEMTPTLARMVANKRRELIYPLRWFSIGNRFRYERMQKGRLREFFQTDVDLIGLPEGEADLEILTIASDLMRTLGATPEQFGIRVSSRALLGAACKAAGLTDAEGVRLYWQLLDKKAKMSPEEFATARGTSADPLAEVEEASDPEVRAEKEKLFALIGTARARGITNIEFDPEIVRGFDYYTGMVFEVFDTDPSNSRSMFGGGRYDGLVAMYGAEPVPAVGFAVGDVVMMDFLTTHGLVPAGTGSPQLYLGTPTPDDRTNAQAFAQTLRAQGVRVFVNLTEKSLGDQIKDADRRGIPLFSAFGGDEAVGSTIRIKTLATGTEAEVPKENVASGISGT